MKKIVPYTDIEILAKIAERRALNYKIQQEEVADKKLALDQYVAQRMDAANIDKTLLSDPMSREIIYEGLTQDFEYIPSSQHLQKIQQMKNKVEQILPSHIKAERWQPGDCGCTVQRIYDKNNTSDVQTFHKKNGQNCHPDLGIEDLHDTIQEETLRRGKTHRFLIEQFEDIFMKIDADGNKQFKDNLQFEWEGTGKDRILVINNTDGSLDKTKKNVIRQFIITEFPKKQMKDQIMDMVKFKNE